MNGFRKIVVAVDGSSHALQAARVGARLADGMQAELVLLHCFPMMSGDIAGALGMSAEDIAHTRDAAARRAFDLVLTELSDRDPAPTEVALVGDVADEILKFLDNARDVLLVMGRRGQTRMGALLLGSVSDKVLRHTRTPVTVVS
jgi:nucleotide-binding universal stress UspA family protein